MNVKNSTYLYDYIKFSKFVKLKKVPLSFNDHKRLKFFLNKTCFNVLNVFSLTFYYIHALNAVPRTQCTSEDNAPPNGMTWPLINPFLRLPSELPLLSLLPCSPEELTLL